MKIYIINIIENLREKCEKSEETPRRVSAKMEQGQTIHSFDESSLYQVA